MDNRTPAELVRENDLLKAHLAEANDTLDAIRTGQVDALVVNNSDGPELYTLESADRAYRVFIEQMAEGAVTLNNDGLITYCNSQFARMIDLPLASVMGNYFVDFVFNQDLDLFESALDAGRKSNVKNEIRLMTGTGFIHVQVSLNMLQDGTDNVFSVIVTDLSKQKEIENQLSENNDQLRKLNEALISSNHDLQQFASVASHDLQEPLRKIQVYSKFLIDKSSAELSEISKSYLEKIFSSSRRMKALIVDILTYSRLSASDLMSENVDLNEVVDEILQDFDLKISERNARVEVSKLCTIEGNKGQLRQVFNNLISNALKFVPPDRDPFIAISIKALDAVELGVSLEDPEKYCRITVTDNGIGFNESYASSIFSLFEKLNPKNLYEGTGIGLAIAKKIIEKHHGIIVAKSRIGEGSEFSLILPLLQPVLRQNG